MLSWVLVIPVILLGPRENLFEVGNALIVAAALGVCVGWMPGLAAKLATHKPYELTSDAAMLFAIVTIAASLAAIFMGLWIWRVTDHIILYRDHGIFLFVRWTLVTGLALLLTVSGSVDGRLPRKAYLKMGAIMAAGFAAALVAMSFGF